MDTEVVTINGIHCYTRDSSIEGDDRLANMGAAYLHLFLLYFLYM
jgi:hypothetical protein